MPLWCVLSVIGQVNDFAWFDHALTLPGSYVSDLEVGVFASQAGHSTSTQAPLLLDLLLDLFLEGLLSRVSLLKMDFSGLLQYP